LQVEVKVGFLGGETRKKEKGHFGSEQSTGHHKKSRRRSHHREEKFSNTDRPQSERFCPRHQGLQYFQEVCVKIPDKFNIAEDDTQVPPANFARVHHPDKKLLQVNEEI